MVLVLVPKPASSWVGEGWGEGVTRIGRQALGLGRVEERDRSAGRS